MNTEAKMELIAPYGGKLVDLMVPADERGELVGYAGGLFSLQLSPRTLCDLELLATGGGVRGSVAGAQRLAGAQDQRAVAGRKTISLR